jgi:esterase
VTLNFKELGSGPPLVMLHGLFGSSDNWLGVAPKLARQSRVFLLDLRNHGHSPHSEAMDYSLMAADLAEFLDAHRLDRVNLLGHSLGGKVAMQFALTYPARVEKLIIVDMAPRPYSPEHAPIFKALMALDLKQYSSRNQIEDALAPAIPDLTLRRFLLKNLKSGEATEKGVRGFEWRIPLAAIFSNYPKLCEAITSPIPFNGPALFLHGGKSPYVSEKDVPEIKKLFPQATIESIAIARHWVHADAPEEFVRQVSEFLKHS